MPRDTVSMTSKATPATSHSTSVVPFLRLLWRCCEQCRPTYGPKAATSASNSTMRTLLSLSGSLLVASTLVVAQAQRVGNARSWLEQSARAMGGETALRELRGVEVSGISALYQREQSERPEGPWIPTFTEFTDTRNFAASAIKRTSRSRGYVTVDSVAWSAESSVLIVDGAGVRKVNDRLVAAATPWDIGAMPLDLLPERVVLTAMDAPDLRADSDITFHGYAHHTVVFRSGGARVRLILNVPSLLPAAIEITRPRPYETYWAPWGDVTQRLTLGVWLLEPNGIRYPRLWEFSTGDQPDGTVDLTRVKMNPPMDVTDFTIPADARQTIVTNRRRIADIPLGSTQRTARELAPGVVQVPGNWDIVEVKQSDGVAIIEGPLTSTYSTKVIDDVRKRFDGAPVKAVITTSDSWPHIGGMREYAARGVPIYALDRNVPILTRLFAATFATEPDALARGWRAPVLRAVGMKTVVGVGANRMELYPLRTVTGERQMMAYFPDHKLLYTSDLFTISNGSVFLPQTVSEAVDAVAREHLDVATAFGMHYDALEWSTIVASAAPPSR